MLKIHFIIKQARALGIADEIKIRNMLIRNEFERLRKKGTKYNDAIIRIADRKWNECYLSEDSITKIVSKHNGHK
jgi:hypothetical protein